MLFRSIASLALPLLAFAPVASAQSASTAAPPVIAVDVPSQPYDAGSLRVLVPSSATDGRFAVVELTEHPPYRTPAHVHPQMDESFYVLEGTLALEIDGRSQRLPAGSFVHIPRGTVHAQGSADDRPVRLLVTLAPGAFEQFFLDRVELAKSVPRSDPGFQDRLLEIVGRYPRWLAPPPVPAAK
ncbi:MAG TPA: cupin domain-containing protein [Thermomonas sp.]|nr:cupin domain-containing protein [Thermomonas sp.]